jgi:cell division protein FtsQ
MKKGLHISLWILLLLAVLLLPAFSAREWNKKACQDVHIRLAPGQNSSLLSVDDLRDYLLRKDTLAGSLTKDIQLEQVERLLETHPYVARAEAHLNLQNELCVDIWTEQPLLRLQNAQGKAVYLSERGRILPLRKAMPVRVAVVNGFLGEIPEAGSVLPAGANPRLDELLAFGLYLRDDPFFHLLFSQIYCHSSGEYTLIPRLGTHKVLLGKMDGDFSVKMENLRAFYTQGLPRGSWDRYTQLNLKYKNQVVCTKQH